jgi:hypothetical protein
MSILGEAWQRVTAVQPHAASWVVIVAGLAALGAVTPWWCWRVCRNAVTIAHEGGHALVALATGRRLAGLHLNSDTSGVTISIGKPTGPGMILTAFAGYVAPAALGLGAASLVATRHFAALLWLSLVLLAAMLVIVRNVFGVFSILVTGAVVGYVAWSASAAVQAGFGYFVAFFLPVAGTRSIIELQRQRRRGRGRASDADQLARLTHIPGACWVATFALANLAALLVTIDLTLA